MFIINDIFKFFWVKFDAYYNMPDFFLCTAETHIVLISGHTQINVTSSNQVNRKGF